MSHCTLEEQWSRRLYNIWFTSPENHLLNLVILLNSFPESGILVNLISTCVTSCSGTILGCVSACLQCKLWGMPQVGHHLGVGKYVCGQLRIQSSMLVRWSHQPSYLTSDIKQRVQMMYSFIKKFLNLLCTSIITLLTGWTLQNVLLHLTNC